MKHNIWGVPREFLKSQKNRRPEFSTFIIRSHDSGLALTFDDCK